MPVRDQYASGCDLPPDDCAGCAWHVRRGDLVGVPVGPGGGDHLAGYSAPEPGRPAMSACASGHRRVLRCSPVRNPDPAYGLGPGGRGEWCWHTSAGCKPQVCGHAPKPAPSWPREAGPGPFRSGRVGARSRGGAILRVCPRTMTEGGLACWVTRCGRSAASDNGRGLHALHSSCHVDCRFAGRVGVPVFVGRISPRR